MVDVRIDTRGVPKGPAYEEGTAVLHRAALTAPDASDPTAASVGVDCAGYRRARFDIDTSGSAGPTALKVQLLHWNGLAVDRVGSLELKDATRTRVKWYVSLALFNTLKLAKLIGVRP